jgi:amino acid transporter
MTDPLDDPGQAQVTAPASPKPQVVPAGYRQGIITAITVLLGFSLAFWRFWGFESNDSWTLRALFAAMALVLAVILQIVALFRSLRVEDDEVVEYRKTVRWFLASAVALLIGLFDAMLGAADGK